MEPSLPKTELVPGRPHWPAWAALAGTFVGWFVLDTLVVQAGPLRNTLKFYDLAAVIADPVRVLFGFDGGHRFNSAWFAGLCAALLLAPLSQIAHSTTQGVPRLPPTATAALFAAPMTLMLLCMALLHLRTSGDMLTVPSDAAPLAHDVLRLANDLLNRGAAGVARTVRPGAGAWLAFASSGWLAWLGSRRYFAGAGSSPLE